MISERHKPKDYDWAFDLRANFADSDDSEGEDDRKTGTANSGLSRDDALLKEIDISSRSDSVNFKPNPFSIAKINAIYRSARAKEPGNQRSPQPPTIQTLNNNQQKSQTKITDRFKVKASKAALPTLSPARPLHSKHSPLEGNSCQLHELVPSSPSSHVIIPGQERCNFDSQDFSAANKHPPKNPGVPLNSIPANISRDSSSNFVRTSSPPQKHAHILAQKRLPGPTIEPQLKENNIVESNRGNFRHSTRFPRIPNRPSFSSPLRPPGWKSLQNGLHKTSSPGPSGCLPRRFLPLAQLTRPSLPNYCDDDRDLPVRSPNLTNRMPNQAEPNTIRSFPDRPFRRIKDEDHDVKPSIKNSARDGYPERVHPVKSLLPKKEESSALLQIGVRLQEIAPNCSRPLLPPPKIVSKPTKRPLRDAYSFAGTDQDEEWCTLPSRKKAKHKFILFFLCELLIVSSASSASTDGLSVTKSFRLPGLLPALPIVSTETTKISGRRVMTYIPPPMPSACFSSPKPQGPGCPQSQKTEDLDQIHDEDLNDDDHAHSYPSPGRPRKNTLASNVGKIHPPRQKLERKDYQPLSPPTSDPPVVNSTESGDKSNDVRISVGLNSIGDNYKAVKENKRKVSFSY